MTGVKPKEGTRERIADCAWCGGPQYRVWGSTPAYHNSWEEGWIPKAHSTNPNHDCILYLRKRIDELERKLEGL